MTAIGESVQLKELEGEDYTYHQNEQDIKDVAGYVPEAFIEGQILFFHGDFVTGTVTKDGDGEYEEIWLSTDPEPWLLTSLYKRCI